MRITSGIARGHKLKVPKISDLRPSQNMVRLAIFSILGEKVKDSVVLDLFAGTGSLGIEALSRGAKYADFVDIAHRACEVIKDNLNHSRLLGKAKVTCRDSEQFVQSAPDRHYDLIFLDPPYAKAQTLNLNQLPRILKEDGFVVYLHAKETKLPGEILGLKHKETRNYGGTGVSFLEKT